MRTGIVPWETIILKSDFPTNHTQLVSNAMFWAIMEFQQIFHQFQFRDCLHHLDKNSEQNPLTTLYVLKVIKGKPLLP